MLISELIKNGAQALKSKKISSHLLDSELIMSKILKKSREKILTSPEKKVSPQEEDNFYKLIIC